MSTRPCAHTPPLLLLTPCCLFRGRCLMMRLFDKSGRLSIRDHLWILRKMAIFKRKAKPAKEAEIQPKKEVAAGQAPMKTYKPRHMTSAALHGNSNANQDDRNPIHSQQFYSQPKERSEETFSKSQALSMAGSQHGQMSGQNSDYLYQARGRSGGFDNTMPFARGRGKADLGKEPGNMTLYSSDSGYESAGPPSAMHSRVPSLQNLQQEPRHQYNSKASPSFIPELRLGEEALEQMSELDRVPTADAARKSQEGILKNNGSAPPLDHEYDGHSMRSTKSAVSVSKKTRFEDQSEPMPALDQLQHHRDLGTVLPVNYDTEASKQYTSSSPGHTEFAAREQQEATRDSARSLQISPQELEGLRLAYQTRDSTRVDQVPASTVQHMSSTNNFRRPSKPPLSTLEGFKVNKKGKILNEEGDSIGELVDGDLLDCVRQKVNEKGEVLDEFGRVVGIVSTIPSVSNASTNPGSIFAQKELQTAPQDSRPNLSVRTSGHGSGEHVSIAPPFVVQQEATTATTLGSAIPRPQGLHPAPQLVVTSIQTPTAMHADQLQYPAPSTPKDQTSHEHLQRPTRTASERSLSELGRSYARPPMDPVPEDNVPEDDIMPVESAELFAYKGEIPLTDARLPSRSNVDLGLPGQLFPSGRVPMASRRATTFVAGGCSSNNLNPKLAMINHNSRRSPMSSHETSPKRSEAGTDSTSDDMPTIRPPHVRTPSMRSAATTVDKPRTYFTHGGQPTVDTSTPKPEKACASPMGEPVVEKAAVVRKKSRFSMGFGSKK